jgi:hypothetical protein
MAALLPVHVHNILLGRTLKRVYLAGTGCVCASTAVAYKRKVFPSTLCPTVRHRGLVAGVVPNCALSSRLMLLPSYLFWITQRPGCRYGRRLRSIRHPRTVGLASFYLSSIQHVCSTVSTCYASLIFPPLGELASPDLEPGMF